MQAWRFADTVGRVGLEEFQRTALYDCTVSREEEVVRLARAALVELDRAPGLALPPRGTLDGAWRCLVLLPCAPPPRLLQGSVASARRLLGLGGEESARTPVGGAAAAKMAAAPKAAPNVLITGTPVCASSGLGRPPRRRPASLCSL